MMFGYEEIIFLLRNTRMNYEKRAIHKILPARYILILCTSHYAESIFAFIYFSDQYMVLVDWCVIITTSICNYGNLVD